MNEKPTQSPTWHTLDNVLWSIGGRVKSTSKRTLRNHDSSKKLQSLI